MLFFKKIDFPPFSHIHVLVWNVEINMLTGGFKDFKTFEMKGLLRSCVSTKSMTLRWNVSKVRTIMLQEK